MDPDDWHHCAPYRDGLVLFNAGYYWEAHELWEGLWIAARRKGAIGEFLQGLIQLAAAGLKVRQRQLASVRTLAATAARHFERAREEGGRSQVGGLTIVELLTFAEHVRAHADQLHGSPGPLVEVVFEQRLQPRELDSTKLASITAATIDHYNARADAFWAGTRDHDVSQNRATLLRHLEGDSPATILDLGCGPGRDLLAFTRLGHLAIGLDGAARFCEMARRNSGCHVLHQNLLALDLPRDRFDGIFANAVLFHVPTQELARVLDALWRSLVTRGVLFCSNPRGSNEEGWHDDRYGVYHDHTTWSAIVCGRGFEELEHYYRPPGRPRHQQPWLATVFRKVARA